MMCPLWRNVRHQQLQRYMNTNKHTAQTSRQAEAGFSAPQSGKRTSPARKTPEIAAKKAVPKASSGKAPQVQEAPAPKTVTTVEAMINVGIGNALFIRGQGDGLSWDKGLPLNCMGDSIWVWSTTHARDKVVFKLLLNDQVWANGEDVVLEAGRKLEIVPSF